MGVGKEKTMKLMWGDSFVEDKKKTWTNVQQKEVGTEALKRDLCQLILTSINQLMRSVTDDQKEKYDTMTGILIIVWKGDDKNLTPSS